MTGQRRETRLVGRLGMTALVILMFAGHALAGGARGPVAEAGQGEDVLILHSHRLDSPWVQELQQGFVHGFQANGQPVNLVLETLNSVYYPNTNHWEEAFVAYLQAKYATRPPRVIIVADNHAFDLICRHGHSIFPEVPVVFTGVNDVQAEAVPRQWMTGVAETPSFAATLAVMRDLQPQLSKVIVLGSRASSYQKNKEMLLRQMEGAKLDLELLFVEETQLDDMLRALATVDGGEAILALSGYVDEDGNAVDTARVAAAVGGVTHLPIYSCWDVTIGTGIVGGCVISGQEQGYFAAAMATQILQGKTPAQVPLLLESPNRYLFDLQALHWYGLDPRRLPPQTTYINHPVTFYGKHKVVIDIGSAVVLVLLVLVVVLLINIRRRQRAEAVYRELSATLSDKVAEKTRDLELSLAKLQEAQAQLVQTEKMSALMYIIAGVCHEINTPLGNALLACSVGEEVLEKMDDPATLRQLPDAAIFALVEEEKERWQLIKSALLQVVRLLQRFEQVHMDDESFIRVDYDICQVIQEVVAVYQPRIEAAGHRLQVECQMAAAAYGNPGAVAKVVEAILDNALNHGLQGQSGGQVTIQVAMEGEDSCRIILANTGRPIPAQVLSRIFDPFFTTSDNPAHAGLGLSVAYNFATRALGGHLEYLPSDQEETVFVCRFPLRRPDATRLP